MADLSALKDLGIQQASPEEVAQVLKSAQEAGDLRPNGTPKGAGYFGGLKTKDGSVATELTVGVEVDGQELDIPLLVPSLEPEELKYLLQMGDAPIPQPIISKAVEHAVQRIKQGLSPYAD